MKLTSEEFDHCDYIPSVFTCDDANQNPPLCICDVPENAKSLALIMDDPDAPNGTFVHWLMWNIDPATKEIDSGDGPPLGAVSGTNSSGSIEYTGPCPPKGEHRYFFKLYALDNILDLPAGSNKNALENAMQGHILDQTELIGLYER